VAAHSHTVEPPKSEDKANESKHETSAHSHPETSAPVAAHSHTEEAAKHETGGAPVAAHSHTEAAKSDVKIEEEEDIPDLEPVTAPSADESSEAASGGKGKQSRSEKKSRKAVTKLGLKQVEGVLRVNVKGKNVYFVINNPDVYKSPSNDTTWVVFGEAKIEDTSANAAALQKTAQQFATKETPPAASVEEEMPELVPTEEPKAATEEKNLKAVEGEEGIPEKHIDLVMEQVHCTRAQAVAALTASGGDIVNAIMEISMGNS